MMEVSLVTILIPCYNQPELLKRCLKSICEQTFRDYHIMLIDDCSIISYESVLFDFKHLNIVRIINTDNLGAVPNMIYCMKYPVKTPYKIVFHEDDIMHPLLLQKEINAFRDFPEVGWVGTDMTFFNMEKPIPTYLRTDTNPRYFKSDFKPFVESILRGCSLSLASIMYNCKYTNALIFDLENFSMLGDRHMLLEHGKKYGCVYIDSELVAADEHGESDRRWKELRKEHIYNYYIYLKTYFTKNDLKRKKIISGFTRAVVSNFNLLEEQSNKGLLFFLLRFYLKGIISLKYLLLENEIIRKFADKILKR